MTEAAARRKKNFQLAVEASPSGMVMIDGRRRDSCWSTPRRNGCSVYSRQELIGQPVDMLVPPSIRGLQRPAPDGVSPQSPLKGGWAPVATSLGIRKDGSEFPVEIGLNPIHTRQGPSESSA